MIIEENWAIDPRRVRAFFAAQPDAAGIPDGFFISGCTVTLTEAEGTVLGQWAMRRTIIRIEGEEAAVKEVHRRFFLRFLSAGG